MLQLHVSMNPPERFQPIHHLPGQALSKRLAQKLGPSINALWIHSDNRFACAAANHGF